MYRIVVHRRAARYFLRFLLIVEPGDGSVWLEVTGPEGTEDLLSTIIDITSPQTSGST